MKFNILINDEVGLLTRHESKTARTSYCNWTAPRAGARGEGRRNKQNLCRRASDVNCANVSKLTAIDEILSSENPAF
eukprot:7024503-Pyramimonas_sp.AAC.1